MARIATEVNGMLRKDWKALAKVVAVFKKTATKFGWLLIKVAQSEYTKELIKFLVSNAELIIKAVLTAAKAGGSDQEKHDIAVGVITDTLPDLKSNVSWINLAIQLAVIVIKLLTQK